MGKSIKNLSSVTIVGLDIAKNVIQVHGVDTAGAEIVAKAHPSPTAHSKISSSGTRHGKLPAPTARIRRLRLGKCRGLLTVRCFDAEAAEPYSAAPGLGR
jgi:hypothetical protein